MIVNFVLILTVLLGCCGLAMDVGLLELKQMQLQNAADAAALGAAYQMERENTSTNASAIADYNAAAIAEAGQNGFVNGTNNVQVTSKMPPISGMYANNLAAVQVSVSQKVSTIFKVGSYTIGASATGVVPPCVYFMSTNPSVTTITVINNTHIQIGCAGYAGWNGYSDSGTYAFFNALYVGGPYSASSFNGSLAVGSPGYYPTFNAPILTDPLSYEPSPAFSGCTSTSKVVSTTQTLLPGVYCGTASTAGLTINGGTVTFKPGLYIITGGGSWTNATISGSGVMFYLTKGNGANYGQLMVGSSSTTTKVTLSAPTMSAGGALASIVIFGDRSWSGNTQDVYFLNTTFNVDGIIYLTNTGMSFKNGTLTSPDYFGLVIDNFTMDGSTFVIQGNYSGVSGGNPYRPGVGLAE